MFRSRNQAARFDDTAPLGPDLAREVRRLHVLTRRRVSDLLAGEYHSAFKGHGIEFAEVREYEPGDDVRSIDWNVTARTGKTFIKRFVEERQLTVVLAIDLSRSGAFGTTSRTKRRLGIEAAAVLALAATQNQDRVGLMMFTDRVEKFVPPRKGGPHCQRLIRDLLSFRPEGEGTDLCPPIGHLSRMMHRRALVFLISDFEAPPFAKDLAVLSRRHDVVALSISDPTERRIPSLGLVDIVDPETGAMRTVDLGRSGTRRYSGEAQRRRDAIAHDLAGAGVDVVPLSTDRPFVNDLAAYFRRKEGRR